jgi:type 1 glutamine amidotransferase
MRRSFFVALSWIALSILSAATAVENAADQPIRVLLVTGGCCHDYEYQTKAMQLAAKEQGVAVDWTVVNEGGKGTRAQIGLYEKTDWAAGYDVVIHNECFADTDDESYIRRITGPHFEGVNAVVIHCAMHTYRSAKIDDWRELLGVTSRHHEHQSKYPVKIEQANHPIMRGFPSEYKTPMDELYIVEKIWPNTTVLASTVSEKTGDVQPVFWTNRYGKGRVFGTTYGHSNDTFSDATFLKTLIQGLVWAAGRQDLAEKPKKKLLFFTKSAGFEHDVVRRKDSELAFAERIMIDLGKKHGIEVTCTKDGTVFDSDYKNYDAFFFYTTEDLTQTGNDRQPAMSPQGKENLLAAIRSGKGFIGSHCASDTFHTSGNRLESQTQPDPYIAMLGGEFIRHGRQQVAKMRVTSPGFPGLSDAGTVFSLNEEWYSLKNFAPDMHVILVQETEGMVDDDYKRPPYPATWARQEGEGRVFYTSMGHREDVWTNPLFQSILMGGIHWALRDADAPIPGNLNATCPEASKMPPLK